MERSPCLRNQGGGAGCAAPRSCLPCSCSRSRRGGPRKHLRRVGIQPGHAFGLAARAADLSHPTCNLPFQESSFSWEPGACSVVDASALPASSPALPRGLYLCLRGLSPPQAGLGGGVSGWSKPHPCARVGIFGMWKKIRAKAPDTQNRHGWERNQKPACLHPARGWSRERVGGTRTHEAGASPVPVPSGCILTASLHFGHRQGLQGGNSNAQGHFTCSLPGCWWGDTFLQLRNCI